MDAKSSADGRSEPVNQRLVAVTAGLWTLVLIINVVRLVGTGRTSVASVLMGVGGLLQASSHAVQRRGAKWLLASCAAVLFAAMFYMLFRGA